VDAQDNPVSNLTIDDFEVIEDKKPQKLTSFSLVNIPIERAERPLFATAPIEQDVQTNDHLEGRIYLIVLDDLHTEFTRTPRVKAAMRRFFERSFGTNDLAAVVFTGRSNGSQDFTNNPRLLLAAVDKFIGRKLPSATINKIEGVRVNPETGGLQVGDDKDMMERSFNARNAMGTVRKLADFKPYTGTFTSRSIFLISARHCLPFIRGMLRSMKMRSGTNLSSLSICSALIPSSAKRQTIDELRASTAIPKISWSSGSSSTNKQVS
jgi:VWFA-related protein